MYLGFCAPTPKTPDPEFAPPVRAEPVEAFCLIQPPRSLQSPDAALSPRRATHFLLLRQKKVSKEKATLVPASLRFATGNLRCSGQSGSRSNSASPQTIAGPDPPAPALLGASTRVFEVKNSGPGAGDGADEWFLGSDRNFAAQRSEAPAGRAAGSGNLRSDPENARSRFCRRCCLNLAVLRAKRRPSDRRLLPIAQAKVSTLRNGPPICADAALVCHRRVPAPIICPVSRG